MLTREQKQATLRVALVIAKEYASGGGGSQTVSVALRNVYNTINKIKEDIEQTEASTEQQGGGSQTR